MSMVQEHRTEENQQQCAIMACQPVWIFLCDPSTCMRAGVVSSQSAMQAACQLRTAADAFSSFQAAMWQLVVMYLRSFCASASNVLANVAAELDDCVGSLGAGTTCQDTLAGHMCVLLMCVGWVVSCYIVWYPPDVLIHIAKVVRGWETCGCAVAANQ
jgi:hypothetical protein